MAFALPAAALAQPADDVDAASAPAVQETSAVTAEAPAVPVIPAAAEAPAALAASAVETPAAEAPAAPAVETQPAVAEPAPAEPAAPEAEAAGASETAADGSEAAPPDAGSADAPDAGAADASGASEPGAGSAGEDAAAAPGPKKAPAAANRSTAVTTEEGLRAAIAAAPDGQATEIAVSGDISVSSRVVVPAGKNVTLVTQGGGAVLTATSTSMSYVFEVQEGAAFTIDGDDLVVDGNSVAGYVLVNGSFTLERGTLRNGRQNRYWSGYGSGVYATGSAASFTMNGGAISSTYLQYGENGAVVIDDGATGVMNGGIIEDTDISNQLCGSVFVRNADFTMNGGTITGGDAHAQIQTAGGVMVMGLQQNATTGRESTFTMNGGAISDNRAPLGGGVYVVGGNPAYYDFKSKAYFTMNGGSISNNQATGLTAAWGEFITGGGGGVYVLYGGNFTMNDGTISGNSTPGAGGGVATNDGFVSFFGKVPYASAEGQYYDTVYSEWPSFFPASFTMNGGSITGNRAGGEDFEGDSGCGGGVYSASHNVVLNAGVISGNTAAKQGGGAYVGSVPYSLTAYNVVVTGNDASILGGGAWFCPTGDAAFSVNNGAAVYGNTADGAGDDIAAVRNDDAQATTTIADRMLGGGLANWYQDGGILAPHQLGEADPDAARFTAGSDGNTPVSGISGSRDSWALKADPSDTAIALANGRALLLITGNHSQRGGGIGSNGEVTLGNPELPVKQVSVTKEWAAAGSTADPATLPEHPDSVTVWLLIDGQRLESVVLDAANGWTHVFTGLPFEGEYAIEEEPVDGWNAAYAVENESDSVIVITVTNTPTPVVPDEPDNPTPDEPDNPTPNVIVHKTVSHPANDAAPAQGLAKTGDGTSPIMVGLLVLAVVAASMGIAAAIMRRRKPEEDAGA